MNASVNNDELGILIIAAGNSSRLGQPKQLVNFKGTKLIERAINLANEFSENVICILGHNSNSVMRQTDIDNNKFIHNPNWQQGMGSSIALGINFFSGKVKATLILLCDQYLLGSNDLSKLIKQWNQSKSKIVASRYFETKQNKMIEGAPAIFPEYFFPELMALREKGARQILKENKNNLIPILIDNARFDLDTSEDLFQLKKFESSS